MNNKLFTLLLFVLFTFGISLLIYNQEGFLTNENRYKATLSSIQFDKFVESTNDVLSDQIYFRDEIIFLKRAIFQKFEIGEKIVCLNRNYILYGDTYLDNSYFRTYNSFLNTCANKAYNLNQVSIKYPDVDMYVYNPARVLKEPILDSVYFPDNNDNLEETFLSNIGSNIEYKKMEYDNSDLKKYFYRTDHHYNAYGADKAYKDIVEMIGKNHNIGEAKEMINTEAINDNFYGHYFYRSEEKLMNGDVLLSGRYNIDRDAYDFYNNSEKISIDKKKNNNIESHTYESYFIYNMGELIFDYHDNSKNNILVISDSYVYPIMEVLSSHFNKSVFICLYPALEDFELDKTIKDNDIDIVLILQFHQNLYFNDYYFIPIN